MGCSYADGFSSLQPVTSGGMVYDRPFMSTPCGPQVVSDKASSLLARMTVDELSGVLCDYETGLFYDEASNTIVDSGSGIVMDVVSGAVADPMTGAIISDSKPQVTNFTNEELDCYQKYFEKIGENGVDKVINADSMMSFLQSSQLDDSILAYIWELLAESEAFDAHTFAVACRLIAHAQCGQTSWLSQLIDSPPPTLPNFTPNQIPVCEIKVPEFPEPTKNDEVGLFPDLTSESSNEKLDDEKDTGWPDDKNIGQTKDSQNDPTKEETYTEALNRKKVEASKSDLTFELLETPLKIKNEKNNSNIYRGVDIFGPRLWGKTSSLKDLKAGLEEEIKIEDKLIEKKKVYGKVDEECATLSDYRKIHLSQRAEIIKNLTDIETNLDRVVDFRLQKNSQATEVDKLITDNHSISLKIIEATSDASFELKKLLQLKELIAQTYQDVTVVEKSTLLLQSMDLPYSQPFKTLPLPVPVLMDTRTTAIQPYLPPPLRQIRSAKGEVLFNPKSPPLGVPVVLAPRDSRRQVNPNYIGKVSDERGVRSTFTSSLSKLSDHEYHGDRNVIREKNDEPKISPICRVSDECMELVEEIAQELKSELATLKELARRHKEEIEQMKEMQAEKNSLRLQQLENRERIKISTESLTSIIYALEGDRTTFLDCKQRRIEIRHEAIAIQKEVARINFHEY